MNILLLGQADMLPRQDLGSSFRYSFEFEREAFDRVYRPGLSLRTSIKERRSPVASLICCCVFSSAACALRIARTLFSSVSASFRQSERSVGCELQPEPSGMLFFGEPESRPPRIFLC